MSDTIQYKPIPGLNETSLNKLIEISGKDLATKEDVNNAVSNVTVDTSNLATKSEVNNKVDKVTGKGLSSNDFTTSEKTKLAGLSNYNDTEIKGKVTTLETKTTTIESKVATVESNITQLQTDVSNGFSQDMVNTAIQNKIDDGTIANMTIEDASITGNKIADGTITVDKTNFKFLDTLEELIKSRNINSTEFPITKTVSTSSSIKGFNMGNNTISVISGNTYKFYFCVDLNYNADIAGGSLYIGFVNGTTRYLPENLKISLTNYSENTDCNYIIKGFYELTPSVNSIKPFACLTNMKTTSSNCSITFNNYKLIDVTGKSYSQEEIDDLLEKYPNETSIPILDIPEETVQNIVNNMDFTDRVKNIVDSNYSIESTTKPIVCWGDSLTMGAGGGDTNYPKILQELIGSSREVINRGIGGETTKTIMGRIGCIPFMAQPTFTIPSDTSNVELGLLSADGGEVAPLIQGNGGINPCFIDGIEGTLSRSSGKYYFKRSVAGEEKIINRPTPIITDNSLKFRNAVYIIFMGQNGGFDLNSELPKQHKYIIDYMTSANKEYVIIGLTTQTAEYRGDYDKLMFSEFGRRFINAREYISAYGLDDLGLTPTDEDTTAMSEGRVPPQLLADSIHFNAKGYTVLANLVYKRLKEFGII